MINTLDEGEEGGVLGTRAVLSTKRRNNLPARERKKKKKRSEILMLTKLILRPYLFIFGERRFLSRCIPEDGDGWNGGRGTERGKGTEDGGGCFALSVWLLPPRLGVGVVVCCFCCCCIYIHPLLFFARLYLSDFFFSCDFLFSFPGTNIWIPRPLPFFHGLLDFSRLGAEMCWVWRFFGIAWWVGS